MKNKTVILRPEGPKNLARSFSRPKASFRMTNSLWIVLGILLAFAGCTSVDPYAAHHQKRLEEWDDSLEHDPVTGRDFHSGDLLHTGDTQSVDYRD